MVTLQVGKSVFDGAPRNMRTELWMSSLQRKGIGVAASQKYEDMLLSVSAAHNTPADGLLVVVNRGSSAAALRAHASM